MPSSPGRSPRGSGGGHPRSSRVGLPRGNDPGRIAGRSRLSDRLLRRAAACFLLMQLGAYVVLMASLDGVLLEINKENELYNHNLTELVAAAERRNAELAAAAERRKLGDLPKYPINHRREANVRPLSDRAVDQCHKALWHTLETTTFVLPNNESFVITGDIEDLWLRDSAAQIHPLLLPNAYHGKSLVQVDPRLERVVSGLILKTARLIRFDPYANAFHRTFQTPKSRFEREALGRHGYIATWNYELDSDCYFFRMLHYFHRSFPDHPVLREREVVDAASIAVDVMIAEQRHEDDAFPEGELFDCVHCGRPYRYNPKELTRGGKGTATNSSAGLTWSGFRPSDDPCVYGYLIPANMFAVATLRYVVRLAEVVWNDESIRERAQKLSKEIDAGIQKHGIVNHKTYGRIYAYEVDGLGHSLLVDDANVPSLLSIPYLGYEYDERVFANTKRFLFSKDNKMFHMGKHNGVEYAGIGSPHTGHIPSNIWPMAMIMEGLVSDNATHKVLLVEKLLTASAGTGWMHESFNPSNPARFSRPWFCWPDALFAELVMSLTGACPRPDATGYAIKEWTDPRGAAGSAFARPTPAPVPPPPPPPTPAPHPLPRWSLAVVSECVPGGSVGDRYVDASFANKRAFCDRWNATCALSRRDLDGDDRYASKWDLINRTMHETRADWTLWLDCGAAFSNMDVDWRHHLQDHLDNRKMILASKDKNGVNLGVLLVPYSTGRVFAKELEPLLRSKEDDQAALKELLKKNPKLMRLVDDSVPLEKMNSYIDNSDGHRWQPHEWIVHQVWCKNEYKCTTHFLQILNDVTPVQKNKDDDGDDDERASVGKRQGGE